MIALATVVGQEVLDCVLKRRLSEEDHPAQTFRSVVTS
jgi:hypothetical protein